jgi:uncharacterized membrane protein YeaQ/YmgE (transglycosylase-associated protein family)
MGIIAWIVLGLLAGLIARAILPGHDSVGVIATMLIGVVGAVIGGFVAELLGFEGLGTFSPARHAVEERLRSRSRDAARLSLATTPACRRDRAARRAWRRATTPAPAQVAARR